MEHFKLSDRRPLINLNGRKAKFEHLEYKGFSQELIAGLTILVEYLRRCNFDIPGFDVEFTMDTDKGTINVFYVTNKELDFRITCDWEINIKGKELSIHEDGSGSLDVYAGNDWESDRIEFMDGVKFHRLMNNKKKLNYHYELRNSTFKASDDLGRHHSPSDSEIKTYNRDDIEKEFIEYIKMVIGVMRETPLKTLVDVFQEPAPEFLTNELLANTTFVGFTQYAFHEETLVNGINTNKRLLNLGVSLPKDHPYYEMMHDGFTYMEILKQDTELPIKPVDTASYNYGYSTLNESRNNPYVISPKNYNNFFIVDAAVFDKLKIEWFAKNSGQTRLTDKLVDDFEREMARTMVPINEYKGGYEKPIAITNRKIWPDEITLIKKPKIA